MAIIGKDIKRALELLKNDELIGFPTETVYGLAGNALSEKAVLKIFKTKNRPSFDPLIVHTYSIKELSTFCEKIHPELLKLFETFSPGPLTVLFPKKQLIPDLVTSGLERVAVRIPKHELALELLQSLSFPLAAPSANPFGYVSPTTPQHVENQLGNKLTYILDGGNCKIGLESTIIGEEHGELIIYRLGGLKIEAIEEIVGKVKVNDFSSSNPKAPGMLKSHYAPKIKVSFLPKNYDLGKINSNKIGFIGFDKYNSNIPIKNQILLSQKGNLEEAASNLFAALRATEELNVDLIYTEVFPDEGLGKAINDRLKRAVA